MSIGEDDVKWNTHAEVVNFIKVIKTTIDAAVVVFVLVVVVVNVVVVLFYLLCCS